MGKEYIYTMVFTTVDTNNFIIRHDTYIYLNACNHITKYFEVNFCLDVSVATSSWPWSSESPPVM